MISQLNPSPSGAAALPWPRRLAAAGWLDGPALSFYLEALNPMWSLMDTRARVLRVIDETHDTRSFELAPGWGWPRFVPGQHIGVMVEINGMRHHRRYSISSAPPTRRREAFRITVKREPGGLVSNWLHEHAEAGMVLNIDTPAGDFVLPQALPENGMLLLAAGSGITPIMAQLRQLLQLGYSAPISLLHFVRSPNDRIFGAELAALAEQHPQLSVHWREESPADGGAPQRFSPEQLAQDVADYATHHTMLCGPAGFMQAVRGHYAERALDGQLQFESFGGFAPIKDADDVSPSEVTLAGRQRSISVGAGQPLLQALEAAGEKPASGCRQGICQTCKCVKTSGMVRDLVTGEISREPQELIRLCVSAAESDLVLQF